MAGESLQQYKQKQQQVFYTNAGSPSNNFGRNHEATKTPYERSGSNGYPSLIFSNIPNMNWQGKTYDPILANNSVSKNGGSNALTTISTIFTAATGALGLVTAIGQTVSLFSSNKSEGGFSRKESKEIAKNVEDTDDLTTALGSTLSLASGLNEKSSIDALTNTAESLRILVGQATDQKKLADNRVASATKTKENYVTTLAPLEASQKTLSKEVGALESRIEALKLVDTENMTPDELSEHKKKISDLKAELKNKKKELKDTEEQIESLNNRIEVQDAIIKENNEISKKLQTQIAESNKQNERIRVILGE